MIKGIGVDTEEINNVRDKFTKDFISRFFSLEEIEYCEKKKNKLQSYIGKFCAKEAVIKSFEGNLSPNHIEILNRENGSLYVKIKGVVKEEIKCSISHSNNIVVAFVVRE